MTQNKKKGIAKKALSISLVAAMLATSNVPAWASGFETVGDFSVEAQDFSGDSNLLGAPVAENFTVEGLTNDGTYDYVTVGNEVKLSTDLTVSGPAITAITFSVDSNVPVSVSGTSATYTAAAEDIGKKLTATLKVEGTSGGELTKEFYVVGTTFAQANYIDSFELDATKAAWSTAKTALVDGVTVGLKAGIDSAYTTSDVKLVWDEDGSTVTTISAKDVGKSVKGVAALKGPGLPTEGETIETAAVELKADKDADLITDIKWEGSSEDGKAVFTYDGTAHKPVIKSFMYNGKLHKPNVDADCTAEYTYPADVENVSTGSTISADITITPGFEGTVSSDYEIKAISLTGTAFTVNKDFTYSSDGNYGITADKELTVTKNGATLKRDTDYTVSISLVDENKVGDQLQITVEGTGNYSGTTTKTVPIKGMDISDWTINKIDDQTWTGNPILPTLNFKDAADNNVTMIKDTDYEVTYSNNTNVGTAKVSVKGIGNYTGTLAATFEIVANDTAWNELVAALNADLADSADQNGDEFIFTGKPITWVKDVYAAGKFMRGTHFTVTYAPQNTNVGTVKMTVKGKGIYESKSEVIEYSIVEKDIEDKDVKVTVADINYVPGMSAKAILDAVTITYNGKTLREKNDFTFDTPTFNNSTFSVDITGIGNFEGTRTITKKVTAKDISTVTLPTISNKVYNGSEYDVSALGSEFVIKDGTKKLVENTDYVIVREYNNKNVGMATIEVAGRNNYTGTAVINFLIVEKELQGTIVMDNNSPILEDQPYSYKDASADEGITIEGLKVIGTDGSVVDTDAYKFVYEDNKSVGTATVSAVKADKNQNVLIAKATFRIVPTDLDSLSEKTITGIKSSYTYTGSAIEPKVTITLKDGKYTLVNGTDYEVTYVNNISATNDEDPAIIITGKGNYAAIDPDTNKVNVLTEEFTIAKAVLTYADVTVNDVAYAGGIAVKEDITVKNPESGAALVKDTDYTLEIEDNVEVGIAKVTIELTEEAEDNYEIDGGSLNPTFNITKKSLSDCTVTLKNGVVSIKNGEITVSETEYTATKNEDGTYTVKAAEKNYTGTITVKEAAPEATTLKVTNRTTSSVSLAWDKVEGAEGYTVWFRSEYDSSVSRKIVNGGDVTTWKQSGLQAGTKYFYTVKAWVKDAEGNYVFSEQSPTQRGTTKPMAAKITAASAAGGKIKVTLAGKVAGAEKYSMCYANSRDAFAAGNFKVGIRTSYTSRTLDKTFSKGTYYVCVKSYRDLGNGAKVYGAWSNTFKVVVK